MWPDFYKMNDANYARLEKNNFLQFATQQSKKKNKKQVQKNSRKKNR